MFAFIDPSASVNVMHPLIICKYTNNLIQDKKKRLILTTGLSSISIITAVIMLGGGSHFYNNVIFIANKNALIINHFFLGGIFSANKNTTHSTGHTRRISWIQELCLKS